MECRDYMLPPEFPIVVVAGDAWQISDIRSPNLHFHNAVEIGLCHSDSGTLEFQDARLPFKAGDVTLISRGIPHTTYSDPGTASRWSYLFADLVQMVDPMATVMDIPPEVVYKELLYNTRIVVSQDQDHTLSQLIVGIIHEMQQKESNYRHCVRSLFSALIDKASRHVPEEDAGRTDKLFPIAPALRHIDQRYMDAFRVDDLAALCQMSTSYFRRVFTETMGIGPLEYLNHTRIMRACTLLQMTDFSILEVCESVGFGSLSSFNRHFSDVMGQPPTSWRHHVNADRPIALQRYSGWLAPPKMTPAQNQRQEPAMLKSGRTAALGTACARRPKDP